MSYAKHGEKTDVTFRNPFCQGEESSLDECAERYEIYCDSTQSVHVTCDIGKNVICSVIMIVTQG